VDSKGRKIVLLDRAAWEDAQRTPSSMTTKPEIAATLLSELLANVLNKSHELANPPDARATDDALDEA